MGIFDWFRKDKFKNVASYQMMADVSSKYFSWNGNLYQSDVVRACIRPKVRAIGKAVAKHVRKSVDGKIAVNPDVYMRFLLEEPNPYMTGQQLQEKLAIQLEINNNAFAVIYRDGNGYPTSIYPINATSCEAIQDASGNLFIKFMLKTGKMVTFSYADIIHLRKDFGDNDLFGDSPAAALASASGC